MVYEIRVDKNVLGCFTSEPVARKEVRRLKKDGLNAHIYTRFVKENDDIFKPKKPGRPRIRKDKPRKTSTKKGTSKKCIPDTYVNDWLMSKGLGPLDCSITFRELYVSAIVDLIPLERIIGMHRGKRAEIIRGLVEAMDSPAITYRFVENTLKETDKKLEADDRDWIVPFDWEVDRKAADDLERYWRTLFEPRFLGGYRNGVFCRPDERDSDLSVQPDGFGLSLCYRIIADRKVFTVLREIRDIRCTSDSVEITGKDSKGKQRTYSFRFHHYRERDCNL